MMALGHAMSGYTLFAKLKSADISPDGSLGGKGYIQAIKDLRRSYMNIIEGLSANADTFYDELHAPHWAAVSRQEDPKDRKEVEQVLQEVEEIKDDPEAWAEEEEDDLEKDLFGETPPADDDEEEYDLDEEDEEEPPEEARKKMAAARSDFLPRMVTESLESARDLVKHDKESGHKVMTQNGVIKYLLSALALLKKPDPSLRDKEEARQRLSMGATMILAYLEHDDTETDGPELWGQVRSNMTMTMFYLDKDLNRSGAR